MTEAVVRAGEHHGPVTECFDLAGVVSSGKFARTAKRTVICCLKGGNVRVFDTATVPRAQREDAFIAAVNSRDLSLQVGFDVSDGPFSGTIDSWDLEPGMRIVRTSDSGARWLRGERELRGRAPERFAVTIRAAGTGTVTLGHDHRVVAPGDMYINDHTNTAEMVSIGAGETRALLIDDALLGVSVDHVRRAARALATSPLYEMFRTHISHLIGIGDDLPTDEHARLMINTSTLELARALIATAAGNQIASRHALRQSEVARMAVYIRQHLRDSDLSAAKVAHANQMSLRQLYKIWAPREMTLAEHIMSGRLRGASRDLRRAELCHFTIAEIAASWGFVSPAHFSKRFRAAYGVTPYEWRRTVETRD